MTRPCIGCGRLIGSGSRCRGCRKAQQQTPGRGDAAKFRREVLARTGGRCAVCGTTEKVTAHHVRGLREGGTNEASNGVPLCSVHHAELEATRRGLGQLA